MHVLGLPPAFALSQDQTLKLDEIDSGRSHVLTRSIHSNRLLGWCDVPLNVDRQSLFHDRSPSGEGKAFSVRGSGPQGLRRPRFSFFRFTFQTAREPGGPHFPANRKADETIASEPYRRPFLAKSEELREARHRARKRTARRIGGLYWLAGSDVNRKAANCCGAFNRRSQRLRHFAEAGFPRRAALGPHCSSVLPHLGKRQGSSLMASVRFGPLAFSRH